MAERPFVTVCYTQTIDGRLALANGVSQWIGGSESVRLWHTLRAEHKAILVGVNTVCADNPRLTVRHVAGRDPLRIIVDSTLRTPLTAAVLADSAAVGTLFAVTERASAERRAAVQALGARIVALPMDASERVDLAALMASLHNTGIDSLMVEGGAGMITSFLRQQLVDRLVVCIAPRLMGAGIEAVGDLATERLADMPILADVQIQHYGADLVLDGRVRYP